jgi:hypothetical protein
MTRSPDRLFELLPVVHRRRDAERGYPLRALLQVIAEQVEIVEDDIDRLYENWFIETCEDWVVPYLGDLIGYQPVHEAGQPTAGSARQRALRRILVPRREVANTVRFRRRKGILALLELLAHDVAGWPARAVEFYQRLAWSQPLAHQRLERGRFADVRDGDVLDRIDGPFDASAHSVDVRRLGSHRTRGRYNIPTVGLFVWRLKPFSITRAPAYCLESAGTHCYTFSVLGNDAPLFTKPTPEPAPEHIAGPLNVPAPLRRRPVERDLEAFYGADSSFTLWVDGWAGHAADAPLPSDRIVVADLTEWKYRPQRDQVAVDPVLGRIAFSPRQLPKRGVWVSYHYGFSDALGGGEYQRTLAQPAEAVVYRVGAGEDYTRINDALARWREERPEHAVVELTDGGVYVEQLTIELEAGQSFQLRAADRTRPVLRLMDWQTARPDALWVHGEEGSRFTLDGLLVAGRSVQLEGPLAEIAVRHCTLVPGWSLDPDCSPHRPAEPSIELTDTRARVTVERTILGSIQVSQDEVGADPVAIRISDSILDATGPHREAIGAPTWPLAHAVLTIERTTVFGTIEAHAIALAENSIFDGRIRVARRQLGCMRYCYVTPGSRTPRRYRCQPDLAEQDARENIPRLEIQPDARARFIVGGATAPEPDAPSGEGAANLEVTCEVSDPTPQIGDRIHFTVTVHNNGPRDATDLSLRFVGAPGDCLAIDPGTQLEDFVTVSQGTPATAVVTDEDGNDVEYVTWDIGPLSAGRTATLVASDLRVANESGACGSEAVVNASLHAYTLGGDGREFTESLLQRVRQRIRPRFNSARYGSPVYAQLALYCAEEITRGADDESEMGAFHDLFQPQRAANLEARLDEFVPAGMDAGIIYAT